MMTNNTDFYSLFFKFIEAYATVGFNGIPLDDPLVVELENRMEQNNQFFTVGDMIKMKLLFTSKRSSQMIGTDPEIATPYHFFEATHPDDMPRHNLGRAKLFVMAHAIYITQKGFSFLSTNLNMRNSDGKYDNLLFQCYLFYAAVPIRTTYLFQVHTSIAWWKKPNNVFHFYSGNDLTGFRYPDEELLKLTVPFSEREFEIIRLIESGLNSEQIAEKIFLSIHTVNTHRRNILNKTGKSTMSELIYDLVNQGIM
jgi:DNA-binding CsgD family transcriptional regulator